MQERSQVVKINVAPRREEKNGKEESKKSINVGGVRSVTERTAGPVSIVGSRPVTERTERSVTEKTEGAVNLGGGKNVAGRTERSINAGLGRTAAGGLGEARARVVPPGPAPLAAPGSVPPEGRVRVSVRTRPGRPISRKSSGRWGGGAGAAPWWRR